MMTSSSTASAVRDLRRVPSAGEPQLARVNGAMTLDVTLLFTDMEGFSEMTERLGDHRALDVLRVHNALIRRQVAAHRGFEVEFTGDGFLMAFPIPRHALLCARSVHEAFAAHNLRHPDESIRVRIGVHSGPVIADRRRFFGKTVICAARIVRHAKPEEVLVSSFVKQLTEGSGNLAFDGGREVELKGLAGAHRLYRLIPRLEGEET